jgi:hypothetical protein
MSNAQKIQILQDEIRDLQIKSQHASTSRLDYFDEVISQKEKQIEELKA